MAGLSFGKNTPFADSWPKTVPRATAKQPAATSQKYFFRVFMGGDVRKIIFVRQP
jgi:hypothetical protein